MGLSQDGSNVTVMKGSGRVVDVQPGTYNFNDVFSFDDLPVIPRYTEIKGVKWVSDKITGRGTLNFPSNFDVLKKLAVEVGTNEFVSYYGCTIANTRDKDEILLSMRHAIQDFQYSNNYLQEWVINKNGNNGAGLERHDFSHLDCPKENLGENGIFVLAKFIDDNETVLHLTGFKIPPKHCLYIPGGVIHTNDYLKGTWRTMLSDASPIDYAYLEKNGVRFHFQFFQIRNQPEPKFYTRHCFRRSSDTEMANAGLDGSTIRRFFGWADDKVAKQYKDNSDVHGKRVGNAIAGCSCKQKVIQKRQNVENQVVKTCSLSQDIQNAPVLFEENAVVTASQSINYYGNATGNKNSDECFAIKKMSAINRNIELKIMQDQSDTLRQLATSLSETNSKLLNLISKT